MSSTRLSADGDKTDESAEHKTANLARIRDNQRRSRARRKEYLQELEQKYRICEQTGVEASAEIQAAARKVIEENKRLRHLLKQQGLSDADIDANVSDSSDMFNQAQPASTLEGMLDVRRPCGTGSSTCSPKIPTNNSTAQAPVHIAPAPAKYNQNQHYPTPPSGHTTVMHTPTNYTALPSSLVGQTHAQMNYHNMMMVDNAMAWQSVQQRPHQSADPMNHGNTSSCFVAADAIRSIKPDVGPELEQELGCADGNDCAVPNSHIFNLMDRFSEPS